MPSSRCCQESSSYPPKEEKKGEERSAKASQRTPQADGGQEQLQLLICKEKEELLVSVFGGTLEFQRKLHPVYPLIKGNHSGC